MSFVIQRRERDSRFQVFYICKCDVCGNVKRIRKDRFKNSKCNCIAHTHPEIVKHLNNYDDRYKFSFSSTKEIEWKCPDCGSIFVRSVCAVTHRGLNCPKCSHTISYPNRYMYAMLSFYNIDFEREKIFEWSNKKRYDFYIPKWDMIIEMHGEQHYKYKKDSKFCQNTSENDIFKKNEAIINGITHYIEIDCSKSDADFIFNNVAKSELRDFIDLQENDAQKIAKKADEKIFLKIVSLRNNGLFTYDIAKQLKVANNYVTKTIRNASKIGLCKYDATQEKEKFMHIAHELHKKPVICITTGKEFSSVNEASAYYNISAKTLSNCLSGYSKTSGKDKIGNRLHWKYKD